MKGIDVSKHNGNIDWGKVANVDFAIIRAGYGKLVSQKDVKFEANYVGAVKNKLHVGAYWYSYAKSAAEAKQEARACLEVIKNKKFDMPIYFDIEEKSQVAIGNCSALVKAFCSELEANNYYAGVYSYNAFFKDNLDADIRKRYATWVARIPSNDNGINIIRPNFDCGMHQFSFKGKINGISGDVDLDECFVDYPKTIKNKGLNNYNSYTVTAVQKGLSKDKADEVAIYLRKLGMAVEIT